MLEKISDDYKATVLASAGAISGAWKYGVRPELTAGRAWAAIGLGVLAYEVSCPRGELLSEGVDRALEKHRAATLACIGITALHLCNLLPKNADPFHKVVEWLR